MNWGTTTLGPPHLWMYKCLELKSFVHPVRVTSVFAFFGGLELCWVVHPFVTSFGLSRGQFAQEIAYMLCASLLAFVLGNSMPAKAKSMLGPKLNDEADWRKKNGRMTIQRGCFISRLLYSYNSGEKNPDPPDH